MRLLLVWVIILVGIYACAPKNVEPTSKDSKSKPSEEFERTLTLDDVTLEQADDQGKLLWKIKAKQVNYSKDKKMATVKNPVGELYDQGKLLYKIKADQGEFEQNSRRIFLRNNIVATDPNTGLVLKGKELEWIVQQYIIVVRNGVTGDHAQLQAVAREVQVFYRQKRVEFWDKATVSAKDPVVKLQSDHIIWQMEPQLLISNMKTEIERYQNQTITDRGVAETAEMNLKTKIGILKKNAQIALSQPPLQISSQELQWNYEKQTISSPQFITIIQREQQVTLTANQGWGDLKNNIFYLTGNVVGIGQKRQVQLNANAVNWDIRQIDPPFSLMGEKAVGRFENDTIVVSGGNTGTPVVTEIIPE
ncbi:MAG: hypothetical protein RLZZ532_2272 [Cyanobacteriota bacterium]